MAGRVTEEKLESLQRCIRRIEERRPNTLEELLDNWDLQDILSVNLTRAVQLCVDMAAHRLAQAGQRVPDTMAETFEALFESALITPELAQNLKSAVGFRNIAVHAYREINWAIAYHVCHHHLADFKAFAQMVSDEL